MVQRLSWFEALFPTRSMMFLVPDSESGHSVNVCAMSRQMDG